MFLNKKININEVDFDPILMIHDSESSMTSKMMISRTGRMKMMMSRIIEIIVDLGCDFFTMPKLHEDDEMFYRGIDIIIQCMLSDWYFEL